MLAACDAGAGTRAAALRFDVSESWVRRLSKNVARRGRRLRNSRVAGRRSGLPIVARLSGCEIAAHPDMTLQELQGALGAPLSVTTLCIALRQLKLTFKKKS